MRKACEAAVFYGTDQPLRIEQLKVPTPRSGEALVRVRCCTICGSDLHTISGRRVEPTPSILGHEILGTIEALGDPAPKDIDGDELKIGQRVTWSTCVSCGHCDRCSGGLPQKCLYVVKFGHRVAEGRESLSGGLAEFVLLPEGSAIVDLPSQLPDLVACPVNCATATAVAALRAAGSVSGKRVLIFGAGLLGLTAAAMSHQARAARVTVCEIDPERAKRSLQFGASNACAWEELLEDESQDDVLIECSGSSRAIETCLSRAAVGGTLVLVGSVFQSEPVSLDPESVVRRCLTISGVHNYAPCDLAQAVRFLHAHAEDYPFEAVVDQAFALSNANEAIEYAFSERPIRVAVRPEGVSDD